MGTGRLGREKHTCQRHDTMAPPRANPHALGWPSYETLSFRNPRFWPKLVPPVSPKSSRDKFRFPAVPHQRNRRWIHLFSG